MATEGQADHPRGQGQGLAGTHTPVTLVPLCRGAMSQVPTRGGPLPAPHSSLLPGGVLRHSWATGSGNLILSKEPSRIGEAQPQPSAGGSHCTRSAPCHGNNPAPAPQLPGISQHAVRWCSYRKYCGCRRAWGHRPGHLVRAPLPWGAEGPREGTRDTELQIRLAEFLLHAWVSVNVSKNHFPFHLNDLLFPHSGVASVCFSWSLVRCWFHASV